MNLDRKRNKGKKSREGEGKKVKEKRDREIIIALFAGAHCGGVGTTRDGQREARSRKEHRQRPLNRATRV